MTTGRVGLSPGEKGEPWVTKRPNGSFRARQRVRDRDGTVREVAATAATKGAALRRLRERAGSRQAPSTFGISSQMRIDELAPYWLEHRERTGLAHSVGALKPQTLSAYATELRLVLLPRLGRLRVSELSVGLLESVFSELEATEISTRQSRSVLGQMLDMAVRHEALASNPMSRIAKPRRSPREVDALSLEEVWRLRELVTPRAIKRPSGKEQNRALPDLVDLLLGTGCRIGEGLALRWQDLDLDADLPTAHITGTLVEPKPGYVDSLFRQEMTKTGTTRKLILPDHVVSMLKSRRATTAFGEPGDPALSSSSGTWLWPNNMRTRLRRVLKEDEQLTGTTPHTLRRTVGTRIAHEVSLEAVREQLGHSDPSISFQRYVAAREVAPDVRHVLNAFFTPTTPDS